MKPAKSKLFELQQECLNGGVCEKCERSVGYLTVDHIVPQSFVICLDNGRDLVKNDEKNFQKLCQPCNKMKGCAWDFTEPRTIVILMGYLQSYLTNKAATTTAYQNTEDTAT